MTEAVLFNELITENSQKIGVVTLNAEKSLNALNQAMVDAIYARLTQWKTDDSVVCVFMDGQGEKAFCAGGDIRTLRQSVIDGDTGAPLRFFAKEYRLDYLIHTFNKPVICWGNGFVMGGGIGLMSGATYRVVTDTSLLAMPEINIGLYPDVGGSWVLGHMPVRIGLFMALTGCHLNAGDAMYLGLANRFIDHAFRPNVLEALQKADWQTLDAHEAVYNIMHRFDHESAGWLPYSKIREYRDAIAQWMDKPSLPAIMEQLENLESDDEWLITARKNALTGSPLSAFIAYEQLKRTHHLSLRQAFMGELVLSVNCSLRGDLNEGVRALLVDKDKQPKWQFASVKDVNAETLEQFFQPPWGNADHPLSDM
ncbi:enoyl-CoA hydratase/isomerase family protein [Candidatus Sororendozoicomonas aggregata]|uniref:enoyl-CoA hydratase/isomerase family protein n=1 Tax=Candidatus Sororendozoicomonas aggregata TaxID=3073239 RepID=UPI002ED19268